MSAQVDSKSIFATFMTNIGINVLVLVGGVITARLLKPVGRGELATVLLWPTILGTLGLMGCNWALAREAASSRQKEADLARTALGLALPLSSLFLVLGYFLVPSLLAGDKQHLVWLTHLYLLFIPFNLVSQNLIALDHGRMRWGRFNFIRISWYIPYVFLIVGLWLGQIKWVWCFVVAELISNFLAMALRVYLQRKEIRQGQTSLKDGLYILRQGLPFFLASLSAELALKLDKALSVSLLPMEGVGLYAVAVTFASAHGSLGGALGVTSFAALANEPDHDRQGQYLSQIFRQSSLIYLGIGGGMALVAPLLIVPLFGGDFGPAVKPSILLTFATSLTALGNILNEGVRGMGNTYPGVLGQLLGSGALALTAWVMIPAFGLLGMAAANLVGSLAYLLIMLVSLAYLFRLRLNHFWPFRWAEFAMVYHRFGSLWAPIKGRFW